MIDLLTFFFSDQLNDPLFWSGLILVLVFGLGALFNKVFYHHG